MPILNRGVLASCLLCLASHAFGAAAVAAAETATGYVYFFVGSQPSIARAREQALRNCRSDGSKRGKCEIKGAATGPQYWAAFNASNGSYGIGWNEDRQVAIDQAYSECRTVGECRSEAAHVWFDEGQFQNTPIPVAANGCRPPTGKVLRSTTRCDNGDCVRRFENGCTVRFQAAYCYDPMEQRFMWKPDGC